MIGLELLSQSPPDGYAQRPWSSFRIGEWTGPERRKERRLARQEAVQIEFLDDSMEPLAREVGVTENVSRGGLRVRLNNAALDVDYARITCPRIGYSVVGVLRDCYLGQDGATRVCLEFLEGEWPI